LDDIRHMLDRAAAAGVALEMNTSGLLKVIPEMNPFPQMLVEMRQRNIPVVLGSDAHEPGRVADDFEQAMDILAACGYTHLSYFIHRQRHEVPICLARNSLRSRVVDEPLVSGYCSAKADVSS
jgi:histidinol-phosphatase (PHP family)